MMPITEAQKRVLDTLIRLSDELGRVPTYQQIADDMGVCKQGVGRHIKGLQKRGAIEMIPHTPNSIRIKR